MQFFDPIEERLWSLEKDGRVAVARIPNTRSGALLKVTAGFEAGRRQMRSWPVPRSTSPPPRRSARI